MKKIILLLVYLASINRSQVVYEDIRSGVYDLLDELSSVGKIEVNDLIRPLNIKYIYGKLLQADRNLSLTSERREEVNYYLAKYKSYFSDDSIETKEWFPTAEFNFDNFKYISKEFKFIFNPILNLNRFKNDSDKSGIITYGINVKSVFLNKIGMYMRFTNNNIENVNNLDIFRTTSLRPIIPLNKYNDTEFVETNGAIGYSSEKIEISFGQDYFGWGRGLDGNIVLSDNAPSFLFIRTDVKFSAWLRFNMIHAWLNSDVIDTSSIYETHIEDRYRKNFKSKFFISRSFIINPLKGLELSIGESIIFSDVYEVSYLLPFLAYKMVDLKNNRGANDTGSNSQLFFNITSKDHIPNTQLNITFFIDEFSFGKLEDEKQSRDQFAYTLNLKVYDFPFENNKLGVEYTRLNPFVYRHYIQTQTYENLSINMGHWLGHNSDDIYISNEYKFYRGVKVKVWYRKIRKGEDGEVIWQYQRPAPPFLFGEVKITKYYGVKFTFDRFYNIKLSAEYIKLTGPYKSDLLNFYIGYGFN